MRISILTVIVILSFSKILMASKVKYTLRKDGKEHIADIISKKYDTITVKELGKIKSYKLSDFLSYVTIDKLYNISIVTTNGKLVHGQLKYYKNFTLIIDDNVTGEKKELNIFDVKDFTNLEEVKGDIEKSRFGALWRSFIIPGWGQWYSYRNWVGLAFAVSTLATAILGLYFYREGEHNYDLYVESRYSNEAYLYYANQNKRNSNIFFGLMSILWAYNIFDAAYFFKPKYDIDINPEIIYDLYSKELKLSFSCNF